MHVVDIGARLIINFPTKRHWRAKSKLPDIETGLNETRVSRADRAQARIPDRDRAESVDPDVGVLARAHYADAGASLQFELSEGVRDAPDFELALSLALWIALEWDAVRFFTPSPA